MSFTPFAQEWQAPLPPCSTPTSASLTNSPSPTSAPRPSKAVPERRKLRASCDACAASKVKCSKEHPICARCTANGSQCVYGVSRKHGKPGRTRKRNPDGTPFVKASKNRPGEQKFRIRPDPPHQAPSSVATPSWPSTPEWPATPEFEYKMTDADFCFMDDMLLANTQPTEQEPQDTQPELTFRDPFPQKESSQLDLALPPDFQALKNFVGGDSVNPFDYALSESTAESYFPAATPSESPKGSSSYFNPLRASIAMPTSHCCYSQAYSTLESLQFRIPENDTSQPAELKSLDAVLCVTKEAVQSIKQLLSCSCAADPHLAMLYSSITSKIITWYQIAAGTRGATFNSPPTPALSAISSPSASSSTIASPLPTPSSSSSAFNIKLQPLKIGQFEFDEADQEALRRQVVLRELKKCGALIESLANWRSESNEQAEFLYDMLGGWLKSELYKTVREISGEQDSAV